MKSILYQQAQGKERETTTRPRMGTHSLAGVTGIVERGVAFPLEGPAKHYARNWSGSSSLRIAAAMFTAVCTCGNIALGANHASLHSVHTSFSAYSSQPRPEIGLQVPNSVDPVDGCEEGCHYCNGPETD
ncbi:hypothetical protein J2W15_003584 [Pseudarthrobacter sulfonivorans]|nr:hypothetical protein [Pseudarthrobacter sulfonivorans]